MAANHQFFHAVEDESYFHVKHKTWGWKREVGEKHFCGFLITFISSINFNLVIKCFTGSYAHRRHFNELLFCAWAHMALIRCIIFSITYWCQHGLGIAIVSITALFNRLTLAWI